MSNTLKQRLEDFSKTKMPKKSNQFTIAVNFKCKEKFDLTKKQYNLSSSELMMILLEGVLLRLI